MGPLYLAMMTVNNYFDKCKRERFFMAGRTRNCEAPTICLQQKRKKDEGCEYSFKKGTRGK